MFKALRVFLLLMLLMIVFLSTRQAEQRSTDWSRTLWVKLYPLNGDGSRASADYIAALDIQAFRGIEDFFMRETARYGRAHERPVRIELGQPLHRLPPSPRGLQSALEVMLWSLKMRWWIVRVPTRQDEMRPDVRLFLQYHEGREGLALDSSLGVRKGLYGLVNAFAADHMAGSNTVVIAHELLHILGASDKYDLRSGQPRAPEGLAEPQRQPLYPQRRAEIMGGRIALGPGRAKVPESLKDVVIGPATAREIQLLAPPP